MGRELLSEAIKIHVPLANDSISPIFVKLFSICSLISRYIFNTENFIFSCIISKTTLSSFDDSVMNMASILCFGITMAALCFPFPTVNVKQFCRFQLICDDIRMVLEQILSLVLFFSYLHHIVSCGFRVQ